jgi:Na+/H+-dicarboxylate symporter
MWRKWTGVPLWRRVIAGLILGLIVGLSLGPDAAALKPLGDIFLRAIKLLVAPLILVSIVSGITSMEHPGDLGRIGGKAVALYMATTVFAICIGLVIAVLIAPGTGLDMQAVVAPPDAAALPSGIDVIIGLVPDNPFAALAEGNVLQIIVFAVLLGMALVATGEAGRPVRSLIDSGTAVMISLTGFIMETAPIGVFALIAWVAGTQGPDVIIPLIKLVATVYGACLIHVALTYGGLVALGARLNPLKFFAGITDAIAVAFSTASSSGTLPVTLRCTEENIGVSKPVASFVLPLGATVNMDGTALYQGVAAVFVAQAFGIDLAMSDYLTIIGTATLAAVGSAGVPGAGLIMLTTVLTSVGLPLEGIAVIAGVDRLLDMGRTAVNVAGDVSVTTVIAVSEDALDRNVFNAPSGA